MLQEWKWQPFVPRARANAQAVINETSGAAIDVIFTAGIKTGNTVKNGEIFATHPGHHDYEIDHFLYSHVIVNELEYDETNDRWRFEILADKQRLNTIGIEFSKVDGRRMIATLTAANKSDKTAEWITTFLAYPNKCCQSVTINNNTIQAENNHFSMSFDREWFNTPPLGAGTPLLCGMLLEWGDKCPAGREYINFFRKWQIAPGETKSCQVLIGDVRPGYDENFTNISNSASSNSTEMRIQTGDELGGVIKHLENQIRFNRSYPPAVKYQGKPMPVYTPAASWDAEYFWDAGFIAAGLTEVSPEHARECIAQYIPFSENTVFPNFLGSLSLIQMAAAWNLFQTTRDRQNLAGLYPGLHEIFLYASGSKPWPSGENLDETGDGLLSPQGGGTGLDDAPSQVWTRGYGVGWARQNHYWCEPFEVNPTGGLIRTASVNMTAFALLSAKLLKQTCTVLGLEAPEIYDDFIRKSENSLQKYAWNEATGHFHWTVKDTGEQCPLYDLSGITPLFSASYISDAQKNRLIDNLLNIYLTEYGLTTVDREASFYRVGYWCGAVWMPFHWMFWKALVGLGRLEEAEKTAMNVLKNYARNYEELPVCYEKFDVESGQGCGDFSFSGLASIVLNLWAGYRNPGAITTGFMVIPVKVEINKDLTQAELEFQSFEKSPETGIIVVLKPNTEFTVSTGSTELKLLSDKFGRIEFTVPTAGRIVLNIRA